MDAVNSAAEAPDKLDATQYINTGHSATEDGGQLETMNIVVEGGAVLHDAVDEQIDQFWLTPFAPELEHRFQASHKQTRRVIVVVATLVLGVADIYSSTSACLTRGPFASSTDRPMMPILWIVIGTCQILFALLAKKSVWEKVHSTASTWFGVWVVTRLIGYAVLNIYQQTRSPYKCDTLSPDTVVAIVCAALATPMMLSLAALSRWLIGISHFTLVVTCGFYLLLSDKRSVSLSYFMAASICMGATCYFTVLHQRQAFVREELIRQVSLRELSSLQQSTLERAAAKLARAKEAAYSDLVAATVHDLRSPLAAVASGAQVTHSSHSGYSC